LYHHQALDYGEVDQVGNRYFSDEDRNLIDAASASGRSGAILRGQYRSGRRAVIISPPNVGQELYDVVDVTDPSLALSASACRVASLAITFAPGVFSQRLVLEGV
jgi:hypothetical protein